MIGETINISAIAKNPDGIKVLKLKIDDTYHSVDRKAPYEFSASGLAAGTYSLMVVAIDVNGNINDSETISITVEDPEASYTKIISPADGSVFQVNETITIKADAKDSYGIKVLKLEIDNIHHSVERNAPYEFSVSGLAAGTYSLIVIAQDVSGNKNYSKKITIVIKDNIISNCNSGLHIDGGVCTNRNTLKSYGLGIRQNEYVTAEARHYDWYMDQYNTGQFSSINCGPTSVTMAMKWADESFKKTPEDARNTYLPTGGWWYTSDIINYLDLYNFNNYTFSVNGSPNLIKQEIDNGKILILCIDASKLAYNSNSSQHTDSFYQNVTGHFVVVKGYTEINDILYFEIYDPYSMDQEYPSSDQEKGKNRYWRWDSELSDAISSWWDYAIVVNPKTRGVASSEIRTSTSIIDDKNTNIVDTDKIIHMPGGNK
jgi:hypothetical protein